MIADRIQNIRNHPQLVPHADAILEFIDRVNAGLPDGTYELKGRDLYAMVQTNKTRPMEGAVMEGHEHYADLQYIVSGRECIYVDYADELTVETDCRPESDCMFFALRPHKGGNILDAGAFGYYAPTDAHMPGIMADDPETVRKIVFKIRVN